MDDRQSGCGFDEKITDDGFRGKVEVELNSSDVSFVVADKQEVECEIFDNNGEYAGNLDFTDLLSGTGFFGVPEG